MGEESGQVTVIIPGSFTDLVKALRELIAGLRDIGSFVGDGASLVSGAYRQRQSRGAARNLDSLSFSPTGSRQYLERIAAGEGRPEDITAIEAQLDTTTAEVRASMEALSAYRDVLRVNVGMAAATKLEEIIYGKFGKDGLRRMLTQLVAAGKGRDPLPEEVVRVARDALNAAQSLNLNIAEVHDLVLAKQKS